MPQFDPTYFVSQIFWLIVTFSILYIVMARAILPKIAAIINNRAQTIEDALEKAENMKNQAQKITQQYKNDIEKAKQKSHEIAQNVYQKAMKEAEEKKQNMVQEIHDAIEKTEQDITKQRLVQVDQIEKEQNILTQNLLAKIIGTDFAQNISDLQIIQAVEKARKTLS